MANSAGLTRRKFVRLAGGGLVLAATAATVGYASMSNDFPAEAVKALQGPSRETDVRRRAVAYAITAPNPHNLQPRLVDLREANAITIRTDKQRVLPETDPFGRQILIGHGAFLELLVMALAEQGLASEITLWPQGETPAQLKDWDERAVAKIALKPGAAPDPLFQHILKRHTPKVDFDVARRVSAQSLLRLLSIRLGPGVQLAGTVDPQRLAPLRELCRQSAKVELLNPRTVMESIQLTRVGPTEILKHRDGISINAPFVRLVDAMGLFDRQNPPANGSPAYNNMLQRFDGHSRSAMGFVWLSTPGNSRSQQIEAGRAYVRLQLKATELGVGMHPMSQALQEFAEMQPHYEQAHQLLLGLNAPKTPQDTTLQMFCRLGYPGAEVAATPRRKLDDFVIA